MKKIILIAFVLTGFLFVANPIFAQVNNVKLDFPIQNFFTFVKKESRDLYFNWRLPIYVGGEPYEGYTAIDMLVWTTNNSNSMICFDGNWGITHRDEEYLYGYAVLEIWEQGNGNITMTGITNGPMTIGF